MPVLVSGPRAAYTRCAPLRLLVAQETVRGLDHQPCEKVHHVSQDRVLHPLGLPLMPQ